MTLKIGILQTDSVLDQFQPEFGNYPEMFTDMLLKASDGSAEIINYDVEHFQYPVEIDECDAYIMTGSKLSAYDDEPWIHELLRYIVRLHEAKKKLVGICFGHQLIALALGGKTEPAKVGWRVGVQSCDILVEKDYMQPPLRRLATIASHKDQVTLLPLNAELIAGYDACPNSMYQIENHIFAYQGHPEFSKPYSNALMDFRREILGEAIYNEGVESLTKEMHSTILSRWIINFIER